MNIVIGLTGPTGAGKSSVGKICAEYGFKHIDCDLLSRKAVEKGSDGLCAVVHSFGKDILNADGTLNRKALANIAFSSVEKTELLNNTLFPFIEKLVLKETESGKILLDAPTLFESGIDKLCRKTIAVLSNENIRFERIIKRDNLTEEQAKLRMRAGKPDSYYIEKADFVLYNNSDEYTFIENFKRVLTEILK